MITKDKHKVDVIIVSYGNPGMTIDCVESLRSTTKTGLNIIIVDNASPDDTVDVLRDKLEDVRIVENEENLGYAGAVNVGAADSDADFLLISNNDVIYKFGVIDGLMKNMVSNDDIGVIGPEQEYADGSWQISHGDVPGVGLALKKLLIIEGISNVFRKLNRRYFRFTSGLKKVGYVDGAVMLVRREVFEKVNGFDTDFSFYSEETDFCYRVKKAGYNILTNPGLIVTHLRGGANNFGNLKKENIERLVHSKVQFSKKHNSDINTRLYIMLEKIYSLLFFKVLGILEQVTKGDMKKRISGKTEVMSFFYDSWEKAAGTK